MLPDQTSVFSDKIQPLMDDRHHGVLLSTLTLVIEILETGEEKYK